MPLRFEQVTDEELEELEAKAQYALKKAKGLRKKDRRQRKLKQAQYYVDEIQREKEDRKGISAELLSSSRKAAKMFSLNQFDDSAYAKTAAWFNNTSVDEEMARIASQDRLSKDNTTSSALATAAGALGATVIGSKIAGQGVTRAGTAARQGALGVVETSPFAFDALEKTKTYVKDKNLREGTDYDELSYVDFMRATSLIVAGAAGGAAGGALMGPRASMKETVDWASSSSGKPYTTTVNGGRTQADDLADESLDAVSSAAMQAQPMVNEAFDSAIAMRDALRRQLDAGPQDASVYRQLAEPGPAQMSRINEAPWRLRKTDEQLRETQRGWRDASTLGEVYDAVTRAGKNFMKDKIWGVDQRLRWEISENLGGAYQMGNTKAVRDLTNEIKQYVEPMEKVFKLNQEDAYFQALLLDYGANSPAITRQRVMKYIENKLSPADARAFDEYANWSQLNSYNSLNRYSGVKNPEIFERNHLHTKLTPAALERKKLDKKADYDDLELPVDPATLKLSRNYYFAPDPKNTSARPQPSDYLPVLQTDLRRIMTNRLAVEVSEAMDMPLVTGPTKGPQGFLNTMQGHMMKKGVSQEGAEYAVKQIKDHMIGVNRSPELWIQALNNGAYGYVLSGPKSAILNLHDPAMATVNFDVPLTEIPGALKRAYTNKAGADVIKSGIDQNVGEFVNQHIQTLQMLSKGGTGTQRWWADKTRQVTNQMMKIGQFEKTDIYSKNGTLNVILEQMVREAKDGTFVGKWGFYMPPEKINKLVGALKKNGADFRKYKTKEEFDLVEDIAFAGLGQQQLIAGSGRSAAWARHPNLRPMWALRGFASQQQGILMWKTVDQWRKGNKKEALNYLGMYATVVGTSFGLLNESRQWLFGDGNFDLTGVFMGMADQLVSTASVNTIGLNDYQWGRIMEVGIMQSFAESLVPIAVDVPFGIGKNFVDTLSGDQGPLFPIGQVPLVKQVTALPQNFVEDLSDNISGVTFDQVDVSPYIVDPQQEVLRRVGLLRQRNQD